MAKSDGKNQKPQPVVVVQIVRGKTSEHQRRLWVAFWRKVAQQAREQADQQQAGRQSEGGNEKHVA